MPINIYSTPQEITAELPAVYYHKSYFQTQTYQDFIAFSDKNFFTAFDLLDEVAISIPKSPFGSIFCLNSYVKGEYFMDKTVSHLKEKGIRKIVITHPSAIYRSFLDETELIKYGFKPSFSDINQHVILNNEWESSIHKMQKRKLESLQNEGFEFRKMANDELETAHKFMTVCRQAQGLQINISWEHLKTLNEQLPGKYECFGVFREGKISALCIAVNVSDEVAYYYLPGTSPMFRNQSPMVMLIAGMVNYYRENGFKYLDLGVSSIEGKPQETLKMFKERMGAVITEKPTLTYEF
ncbi:GNAT family N-acetyltransferase [Ekhidna sp.]|uniref:GNAT family N-acetyltransferase n=1 Tax=Ekhidna sp. TaxID=2608089 RepID=UPI003B5B353E